MLTTHQSSYPTWILLNSTPIPTPIRRSDLGNAICEALVSAHRAVQVPPTVNDIAESLPWILWEAPNPVVCAYPAIAKNLYRVCVINNNHIHPHEAHFLLTMIAGANILQAYLCTQDGFGIVMGFLERHLNDHYGQRIRYIGFKQLVLDSFSFLSEVSNICLNIYSAFLKLLMYCSRLISFSAFTCSFFIRLLLYFIPSDSMAWFVFSLFDWYRTLFLHATTSGCVAFVLVFNVEAVFF